MVSSNLKELATVHDYDAAIFPDRHCTGNRPTVNTKQNRKAKQRLMLPKLCLRFAENFHILKVRTNML